MNPNVGDVVGWLYNPNEPAAAVRFVQFSGVEWVLVAQIPGGLVRLISAAEMVTLVVDKP